MPTYKVTYSTHITAVDPLDAVSKLGFAGSCIVQDVHTHVAYDVDTEDITGCYVTKRAPAPPVCTCGLTPTERNWANDKTGWGS